MYFINVNITGFGGLGVACWPLPPKFAGSNPAEAVRFLGRKNPQHALRRRACWGAVPCRRFVACKRSLNLRGSRNLGKITTGHLSCPQFHLSLLGSLADGSTWRLKWERLKAGESNGKLPPRTCPGCSVPEPYRSHDWALVPAKPGLRTWILMNEWIGIQMCTQHQWLSLLCRPEDDRLIGRNM